MEWLTLNEYMYILYMCTQYTQHNRYFWSTYIIVQRYIILLLYYIK